MKLPIIKNGMTVKEIDVILPYYFRIKVRHPREVVVTYGRIRESGNKAVMNTFQESMDAVSKETTGYQINADMDWNGNENLLDLDRGITKKEYEAVSKRLFDFIGSLK